MEFKSGFARYHQALGAARGAAQVRARAEAQGQAAVILQVLKTRGISVSKDVRQRIVSSTDMEELAAWLACAVLVEEAKDLFE
ncbi:hypothetical protein SMC26_37545 [Actinomadura fulvescens]|uniref:Uncharacterized protein n=1 Tax=Actinomadura fulvescens TaxID=46160 RepID=A0ABN3P917_9ACTN